MNKHYRYLRIALTESGLPAGHFFSRGLPEPTSIILTDHSTTRPQSTGGQARLGYARASIIWDTLTQAQANVLRRLIEEAETTAGQGNGILWLTLPRTTAASSGQDLVDVYGKAPMPEFNPAAVGLYQDVVLTLNNITVENEPSTVL